jgi:hypothetical protein
MPKDKDDHVTESIIASDRAVNPRHGSLDELRAAFDEVCDVATHRQHSIVDYDQAVAKVKEIKARLA